MRVYIYQIGRYTFRRTEHDGTLHSAQNVASPALLEYDTMPSRIKFETARDALYQDIQHESTPFRLTRDRFYDIMRGHGIASSKDALRTLWAQVRYADWNIYTGGSTTIVLVSIEKLSAEIYGEGGAYTHIHTHTEEVA